MKTIFILLGILDPEPAYAELPEPPRVVELHYIEVNSCRRHGGTLDQVVFWRVDYDKHTRTYETIDCGWKHWHEVAFFRTDDGWVVVSERDNTVWMAPAAYWSITDFDPELVYRDRGRW